MEIINAVSGGAVGAVMGAIGSVANRGVGLLEMKQKRQDRAQEMAHEAALWSHEQAMAQLQQAAKAAEASQAAVLSQVQGSFAGLSASIAADANAGCGADGYPWVAAVRSLTRPVLTVLLWILFGMLFLSAMDGRLPGGQTGGVLQSAIQTVSFSAATALAWWFGDRAPRP